jgi:hypothetical protein
MMHQLYIKPHFCEPSARYPPSSKVSHSMEAFFDNKANILNAQIRTLYDNSAIYSVKSIFGFRGRKVTFLQDANPTWGSPVTVGAIHWREKTMEVYGHKKPCTEVKKHDGNFFARWVQVCSIPFQSFVYNLTDRTRIWRWSEGRTAYRVKYHGGEWIVRSFFLCRTSTGLDMLFVGFSEGRVAGELHCSQATAAVW